MLPVAVGDGRIAATISQGAAMDGFAALLRILDYAGARQLLRLTWHGLRDAARALTARPPHLIPVVGPPGSLAAISAPGAEAGYQSITGLTFRNEMCSRGVLSIALNRPLRAARKLTMPILLIVADQDNIAPPDSVRQVAEKAAAHAETHTFSCGHFDIYTGETFARSVALQVDFLTRHLSAGRET